MVGRLEGAILAAGAGNRLRPAVDGLPKPLVEIGGLPMLVRQAQALRRAGAGPIFAVVNSETARIARARGLNLPPSLRLCVRDTESSMESLFALGEMLSPGRFLAATVDSFTPQFELDRFAARALELTDPAAAVPADGVLAVTRWRGDRRPLFACVGADGLITALGASQSPMVTAGYYLLSTRVFDFAGAARAAGLDALRRFLALLIDERLRIAAIEVPGVIDVDEGADLAEARAAAGVRPERR